MPFDCPIEMSPVIVLVELISHRLRPLTLVVRLTINIARGGVILYLVRSSRLGFLSSINLRFFSLSRIFCSLVGGGLVVLIELGAGVFQSVVFCLLLCQYLIDHRV